MNWDVIAENLPLYVEGAKLTLLLAFTSLATSPAFGRGVGWDSTRSCS